MFPMPSNDQVTLWNVVEGTNAYLKYLLQPTEHAIELARDIGKSTNGQQCR
jgi:hypothetical protein